MDLEITVKLTGKKNTYFVKVGRRIIGIVLETKEGFAAKAGTKNANSWEGAPLFSSPGNAGFYIAYVERYISHDDVPEKLDWDRHIGMAGQTLIDGRAS